MAIALKRCNDVWMDISSRLKTKNAIWTSCQLRSKFLLLPASINIKCAINKWVRWKRINLHRSNWNSSGPWGYEERKLRWDKSIRPYPPLCWNEGDSFFECHLYWQPLSCWNLLFPIHTHLQFPPWCWQPRSPVFRGESKPSAWHSILLFWSGPTWPIGPRTNIWSLTPCCCCSRGWSVTSRWVQGTWQHQRTSGNHARHRMGAQQIGSNWQGQAQPVVNGMNAMQMMSCQIGEWAAVQLAGRADCMIRWYASAGNSSTGRLLLFLTAPPLPVQCTLSLPGAWAVEAAPPRPLPRWWLHDQIKHSGALLPTLRFHGNPRTSINDGTKKNQAYSS